MRTIHCEPTVKINSHSNHILWLNEDFTDIKGFVDRFQTCYTINIFRSMKVLQPWSQGVSPYVPNSVPFIQEQCVGFSICHPAPRDPDFFPPCRFSLCLLWDRCFCVFSVEITNYIGSVLTMKGSANTLPLHRSTWVKSCLLTSHKNWRCEPCWFFPKGSSTSDGTEGPNLFISSHVLIPLKGIKTINPIF